MRKILAAVFTAALFAAGCGGTDKLGPQETIQAWVNALASHDWETACSLETAEYQGLDCVNSYATTVDGLSAMAGTDVAADLALDPASCASNGDEYACEAYGEFTGPLVIVVGQVDGEWLVVAVT